ncbi:hypothetical protein HYZ82_01200 [Candidatus Nomurabacteria bacterium]|nr:hypothetical protein [Candidatus Nomurabacteria bacterium]
MDKIEDLWSAKFWEEWHKDIDSHTLDLKRTPYDHIEIGAAPVKTKHGWLLVYSHIQNYFEGSGFDRIFGVEAVLLDLNDSKKIIGRTEGPIFVPRESYELLGHVPNVVFPTGAIIKKDTLYIYYGAADMTTCVAHVNLEDLVGTMLEKENSDWHFQRSSKNPIITPNKSNYWESKATFNPAAVVIKDTIHILYRSLSDDNTSYIGYASTKNGIDIDERLPVPVYSSREEFESKKIAGGNSGCEDPRLTKIGNAIYMCYTAFDGIGPPRVAITSISEKNFLNKKWEWKKPILITPAGFDDKDTCIFPEKTKGLFEIAQFRSRNRKAMHSHYRAQNKQLGRSQSRHCRASSQNETWLATVLSWDFEKPKHLPSRSHTSRPQ